MKRALIATLLAVASFSTQAADEVRSVTPFKTIDARGPVSLVVEVGKAHSVRVEGNQKFIDRVTTEVVGGELRLNFDDRGSKSVNIKDGERVVVTMPALASFRGEGAGQMILNNVRGDTFDVNYRGAGSLQMTGHVGHLRLNAEGVGEVVAKDLVAKDADVTFRGIGDVSVHATNRLNASVQGLGNLTYYGKPQSVSRSVTGIGSVNAAR
ncbi:head GIN domain-containing protein [Telluria beijingensis]|uniref:head GIN domain-containing protein n=1 Tax=Telluria beijingensis TaxID=3068633 RepID=UPI00279568F5|nr:head GIN domain-containing protein [Massilia sp. REN29]